MYIRNRSILAPQNRMLEGFNFDNAPLQCGNFPLNQQFSYKRLFFALWPSASVRKRIEVARAGHLPGAGRWTKPENLHVTLVFLGNVAVERIPLVEQAASAIRTPPFQLRFDLIRCGPKNMAWLEPSVATPELAKLVSVLQSNLSALDFEIEKREYRAHMTLIRKLEKRIDAYRIEPIRWPVQAFSLVESMQSRGSSKYALRRIWPLRA